MFHSLSAVAVERFERFERFKRFFTACPALVCLPQVSVYGLPRAWGNVGSIAMASGHHSRLCGCCTASQRRTRRDTRYAPSWRVSDTEVKQDQSPKVHGVGLAHVDKQDQ